MSSRSLITLALALCAGLTAALSTRQYLQSRVRQIEDQARTPMVRRVVAARDLPAGTRLGPDNLAVREFPASLASSTSLAPERFTELSGAVLQSALRAGDLVLPLHAAQAQANPFSSRLGKGRRAMTIPVDVINSVSGLLEPGDLIDLYVSFDYRRKRITAPLLQGVLVLATGANARPAAGQGPAVSGSYSSVTLDVSPEDAIKLVAARQGGTLTALLRHPADEVATKKAVRGDLAGLLGVAAPALPTRKTIPVIYGDRGARRLPGLKTEPGATPGTPPLFDLPDVPELVSAWLQARSAPDPGEPILMESRPGDRP
jgi:pilus assembly protein CpaB